MQMGVRHDLYACVAGGVVGQRWCVAWFQWPRPLAAAPVAQGVSFPAFFGA